MKEVTGNPLRIHDPDTAFSIHDIFSIMASPGWSGNPFIVRRPNSGEVERRDRERDSYIESIVSNNSPSLHMVIGLANRFMYRDSIKGRPGRDLYTLRLSLATVERRQMQDGSIVPARQLLITTKTDESEVVKWAISVGGLNQSIDEMARLMDENYGDILCNDSRYESRLFIQKLIEGRIKNFQKICWLISIVAPNLHLMFYPARTIYHSSSSSNAYGMGHDDVRETKIFNQFSLRFSTSMSGFIVVREYDKKKKLFFPAEGSTITERDIAVPDFAKKIPDPLPYTKTEMNPVQQPHLPLPASGTIYPTGRIPVTSVRERWTQLGLLGRSGIPTEKFFRYLEEQRIKLLP